MAPKAKVIEETMLELLAERAPKTACPSDVARRLEPNDWRPLMDPVRQVAAALQKKKVIDVTQRGKSVVLAEARGPIRLVLVAPSGRRRSGPDSRSR